jgi:iron complex outermembrane receptor protein
MERIKMKKIIYLSLVSAVCLQAASIELGTINVDAKADTEVIKDVHGDDIKSADLAEALFKQSPSVSLVRRSGIANDVIVRGQKKDNINVTIDGAKVCGACPNRMDPPVSHVLTNNIDFIEINEGPYNVEDFGVLSADVKIHTIKPSKEWSGDINLGYGSWDYQKAAFTLLGGIDSLKILLSGSTESSEQYKDGDGNDFVGQIQSEIDAGNVNLAKNPQYQETYKNIDAYDKKTFMAKLFWDITDKQELKLSYTANRSDNVLYPSSKMDAIYDDSDIYNIEYTAKNLGTYAKKLTMQVYQSEVEHPMSTQYRNMGKMMYMTHALTTKMQGAKLKNSFDIDKHAITIGVDYSLRNWDGKYFKNDKAIAEKFFHSIYDVDTQNSAFFLKDKIKLDTLVLDMGLRYDTTEITSANIKQQDNDYDQLNGYLYITYHADENNNYFAGFGKSSRVPDGKELYWISSPMKMPDGSMKAMSIGTPHLDATINYEIDVGLEKEFDDAIFKAKIFYSQLDNFIAYNASKKMNRYENVDATIYGIELSGTYFATESLYFDYGMAYQRGEKDTALQDQHNTNMPEIPPFKYNLAANYDLDSTLTIRAEVLGSDTWSDFDAENGEQSLDAYTVLNLKASKTFAKNFELTVGVDNLFDKTYAVSNTYKDLILLPTSGDNEVMLMNEPGRYVYTNLKYRF